MRFSIQVFSFASLLLVVAITCNYFCSQYLNAETPNETKDSNDENANKIQWVAVPATGLSNVTTYRAKVPGGWLVTTAASTGHVGGNGMAFVPDADHSWTLTTKPKTAKTIKPDRKARIAAYANGLMSKFDRDKDGNLTKDEMSNMARPPKADKNQDGRVTLDELIEHFSGN